MIRILRDYARSPVLRACTVFCSVFILLLWLVPARWVIDAMDGFCVFAAGTVIWLYGRSFLAITRERWPSRAELMICGIVMVAFGYGVIRGLRIIALELMGTVDVPWVQYLFVLSSVIMVFGAFLHIAATGKNNDGTIRASAWWAMTIALFGGTIFGLSVLAFRWWV